MAVNKQGSLNNPGKPVQFSLHEAFLCEIVPLSHTNLNLENDQYLCTMFSPTHIRTSTSH